MKAAGKGPLEYPARLVDGDEPLALLLRDALNEGAPGPSEQRSFERLLRRTERRPPVRLLALAGAFAVASAIGLWLASTPPRDSIALEAEPLQTAPARAHSLEARAPAAPATTASAAAAPARAPEARGNDSERRSASPADTEACARDAKAGNYGRAVSCYDRIARGSDMAAELALYEKARLQSNALGDTAAAYRTLAEHAQRFPSGVLGAETTLTRIELLTRLGRSDEALGETERALGSAVGRERARDLHLLHAELLAGKKDCDAALAALDKARAAGAHAARLQAVTARCAARVPADSAEPAAPPGAEP